MNLKLERIKRNMNQNEISKLTGVGVNTIVKIEKGRLDGIRLGTLKKIATALNSTVQELFFSDAE